ncbi:hypothetical protein PWT90_09036 [Aphanocladium album]|nr:hypothetical protein PWT90_09036 [Aphanocladium album]
MFQKWRQRARSSGDLEMSTSGRPDVAVLAAKAKFAGALFGIQSPSKFPWPGLPSYLNYVQRQMELAGPACLQPLWDAFGFTTPITTRQIFELLHQVAVCFDHTSAAVTIDEILQSLLTPFGCRIQDLGPDSQACCRQAVFKALSCCVMLFTASLECAPGRLLVDLSPGIVGFRSNLPMEMSRRPISRLIQELGPLLPSQEHILAALNDTRPSALHVSSLNAASLKFISKIRITWTSSLGCHLLFNPLKRTLAIYRFPTYCALQCMNGESVSAIDSAGSPSCPIFALLLREVMLSYRVLFGQRRDSRKQFQKVQKRRVTDTGDEYDPLLDIVCGEPLGRHVDALPGDIWPEAVVDESGRLLEQDVYSTSLEFPLLGARLLKIQEFDVRQQPSRVRDLWRDRRNPLQCPPARGRWSGSSVSNSADKCWSLM